MWHDVRLLNATANTLMGLSLLACVAGGTWWVAQRPMFTLTGITVEGIDNADLKHVNVLTLREGVVGKWKGNFFTTNLEQVRASFESVPWVRRASVRREWPNQLIVAIEEHEALGTWGEEGKLLSKKGDVFTANLAEAEADEDHALPEFSGPEGSEKEVMARYADLRQWFAPLKLTPEAVDLSKRYAWTVRFDNGMSVALGREQDGRTLKDRVDRLVQVYPQLTQMTPKIDTVDMRYQNGLAMFAEGMKIQDPAKPVRAVAKKPAKPSKTTKHI
ncbi:FtsQ-type POTRA domain-containing protein [Massilia arenosa]|uniref:Cell division protein FtsQ n=1 Tax=Zemynaea arenosa TaxID=2561931 RepID=A0A4Y9S9C5_9BURK|nr:cell division protein FtsQ/DivIB [Massilia arenosa]TFW18447.1 FtsQ-type POTRA domain-containing protein [Massilia arenosa]